MASWSALLAETEDGLKSIVLTEPAKRYISAQLQGRINILTVAPDRANLQQVLARADAILVRIFPATEQVIEPATVIEKVLQSS